MARQTQKPRLARSRGALEEEVLTCLSAAGRPLTVFKSTGHAALDVAAAAVGYAVAQEKCIGVRLAL